MQLVTVEDTFDIMKVCFPDLALSNLVEFRDQFVALRFWDIGVCLLYPYQHGMAISYLGVVPGFRMAGYASKILEVVRDMSGNRPMYGEVVPESEIYWALLRRGWSRVPISYVCPPWGSEPMDKSRCLMCSTKKADHIAFIKEFWAGGYRTKGSELIKQFKRELGAK